MMRGRMVKDSISHARAQMSSNATRRSNEKVMRRSMLKIDMVKGSACFQCPRADELGCDKTFCSQGNTIKYVKEVHDQVKWFCLFVQAQRLSTAKRHSPPVEMPIDMSRRCTVHSNTPAPWRKRQAVPGNSMIQAMPNVTGGLSMVSRISQPRKMFVPCLQRALDTAC